MDGGVLIRYLGKWMTFRRLLGLGSWGGVRWGELGFVEALEPFFWFDVGSDFFRSWSDFGRFWEAKMEVKIDF